MFDNLPTCDKPVRNLFPLRPPISEENRKRLEQFHINFKKKCAAIRKLQLHHYGSKGSNPENQ